MIRNNPPPRKYFFALGGRNYLVLCGITPIYLNISYKISIVFTYSSKFMELLNHIIFYPSKNMCNNHIN